MFDEIKKLKDIIVLWLALFAVFVGFFFFFGQGEVRIFDRSFPFVVQTEQSFAVTFLQMVETDLLPSSVTLIVTNPLSALTAQVQMAFLLAFFFTFPVLLYKLLQYIAPALYARERRAIGFVIIPAILLFFAGCIFSYLYVMPVTFRILYSYTASVGAASLFSLDDFVASVLAFMFFAGLMFLLPILMFLLTYLSVISPSFWRAQWRYALLTFLVLSAIITPDGSGVSMLILSAPLLGLYGVGCTVTHFKNVRTSYIIT